MSTCPNLTATYDVYFDTLSTPTYQASTSSKTWSPGTLQYGTTYYWRIDSKDANGTTPGPVWSFTTVDSCTAPPLAASTPNPQDGKANVNLQLGKVMWAGGSQCPTLTATYDVYFGTNPTPGAAELQGTTSQTSWPVTVAAATTYYWQVVTHDANGTVPGPIWSFTTRAAAAAVGASSP